MELIGGNMSERASEGYAAREMRRAKEALKRCEGCDGRQCAGMGWTQPVPEEVREDGTIPYRLCKWGVARRLRRGCEKGQIPFRYVGKTFLSTLMAQQYLKRGRKVIFGDVPGILSEVKRTFDGDGKYSEVPGKYLGCDLLILDDMGAGNVTEWSVSVLYELINGRYNGRGQMVLTSNFNPSQLEKCLATKDGYSAKRLMSRLNEMCRAIYLGEKDRRQKR